MKKWILPLLILLLIFSGCKQSAEKKSSNRKNIASRTLQVEGFVAEYKTIPADFKTSGELLSKESVELKTESAGKLLKVYPKDGAKVSKGSLIAKLDDSELQAEKKRIEATLSLAKQSKERVQKLHEQGSATDVDLEKANAELAIAEAALELISAQIAKTEIRAPFSGVCGFFDVSPGEWLSSGKALVTLSDIASLRIRFALPQRYASGISKGGKIFVTDGERNLTGEGKIKALDPVLSPSSRSRFVEAEIPNKKGEWLSGSFVSLTVPLAAEVKPSISIPAEAITLDDKGAYLFVLQNGKAKKTYVTTALRTPISVTVTDGLSEGDTIAVSGLMNMRDGSSVEVKSLRNKDNYEVQE
ncbi:MAG: efflux RND transporter periplasmic adaptor subunit [Fibrobacteraceae bacterium]|nr:efflux RND transporter periplasmic adaptor subunit [Fibrobacteraceae bacterium]